MIDETASRSAYRPAPSEQSTRRGLRYRVNLAPVKGLRRRADVVFTKRRVAVFVDGPVHDHAVVAERDAEAEDRLFDKGWDVVRFPYNVDWSSIVDQHKRYFGSGASA